MLVRHLEKLKFSRAYNIFVQSLFPTDDVKTPFRSVFGTIPPKGYVTPHIHQEAETLFIIKGNGEMKVKEETNKVTGNDVIFVPPFSRHSLINTDDEQDLIFLTVTWLEEQKQLEIDHYLLLTPPPVPKEKLHLGQIAGPYIVADIFKRFLKLNGKSVTHIIGINDAQSGVHLKTKKNRENSKDTADYYSSNIEKTLKNFDVEVDGFLKTSQSLEHQKNTQKLVQTMYERGLFISKKENSLYFNEQQQTFYEAFVEGICPNCLCNRYDHVCESCGIASKIPSTNSLQKVEGGKGLFFPLSKYKSELKAYYETVDMNGNLREFCEAMLQQDLPDIPVAFHRECGIEMPIPKYKSQKVCVWFEMISHYLSAVFKVENDNGLKSSKIKKVQFLNFDNSFFYVVVLPAIYLSLNPKKKFVDSYVSNECFLLENRNPSTTIWADNFVNKYSSDIARLYLSYKRPESYQSNVSTLAFQNFVKFYNQFMIDYLNDIKVEFQSVGNNLSIDMKELSEEEKDIIRLLQKVILTTHDYYQIENFSPKNIIITVFRLLKIMKQFNQLKTPSVNKLAINFLVIRHLSYILYPITPGLSEKINQMLYQTSKFTWLDEVKILRDYFIDPTINFETIKLVGQRV